MTGWAAVEAALDGMLARRWYTNHGPAAQMLERRLAEYHGTRHAVIATNPTIGLVMLMDGLGLTGGVLLSALAPPRCVQAMHWAGLRPVFCDVDARSGGLAIQAVLPRLGHGVSGVLLSGNDEAGIAAEVAGRGGAAMCDGPGERTAPVMVRLGGFGEAAGIGCILTQDDVLAARLRNIRSSYGAGPPTPVVRTANGRVSEAQAALAMPDLGGLDALERRRSAYLRGLPGRRLLPYDGDLALLLDGADGRRAAGAALMEHGIQAPVIAVADAAACSVAAGLAACAVRLPCGPGVDVEAVCAALREVG